MPYSAATWPETQIILKSLKTFLHNGNPNLLTSGPNINVVSIKGFSHVNKCHELNHSQRGHSAAICHIPASNLGCQLSLVIKTGLVVWQGEGYGHVNGSSRFCCNGRRNDYRPRFCTVRLCWAGDNLD